MPKELYAKPGTYEVTGWIVDLFGVNPSLLQMLFSGDLNIGAGGTVTATVTVLPKDADPVCNAPLAMSFSVTAGIRRPNLTQHCSVARSR